MISMKKLSSKDIKRKINLQIEYLEHKIDGHGGAYSINEHIGRVYTDYVGLKGKISLFLINLHLWYIWKWK